MNIVFVVVGKTIDDYLKTGEEIYLNRIKHYVKIDMIALPQAKKPGGYSQTEQKKYEAKQLEKFFNKSDYIVLLDEAGKQYSSEGFSVQMQKFMNQGIKNLLFVVGGAYGFSDDVKKRANLLLSLSKMTFSHQMVRLFFLEQLYRAFTILWGEAYHHK